MNKTLALKGTKAAMPVMGFGTWKVPKETTASVIETVLKTGYRHLDCACDYGNEKEVGQGIKNAIANGVVKRDDLWVTSKLWNTFHAKEHVKMACEKTLSDLGLEYLDLYLIHFPIALKYVPIDERYPPEWDHVPGQGLVVDEQTTFRETWEAMEELVELGLVKNIGVANYSCALLMDLHKYAKIPPSVLQVEFHPYLQRPKLMEFAKSKGMTVTAFSSFGDISYQQIFDLKGVQPIITHPTVKKIAEKHSKSCGQVLLRFASQQDIIVIPKSCNDGRIKENLESMLFDLDDEDMTQLKSLECGKKFNDPGFFCNYPIWD